ncbi:MAG: hypothetical protein ACFFC7_34870 [Candidatus Hermodarchaeota archaeon]
MMGSQEERVIADKEEGESARTKNTSEDVVKNKIEEDLDIDLKDLSPGTEIIEVEVKPVPYFKMILHSLKYAHPTSINNWVEIIGLMTGYIRHEGTPLERIVIEDAFPIGYGKAVTVEVKDYNAVTRILQDKKPGSFVVGWYHSHPGYGLFLSGRDMATQQRYQKLWRQSIALVLDPTLISDSHYGLEIFRLSEDLKNIRSVRFKFKDLAPKPVPELIEFLLPLVDGKALFLEYDIN